MNTYILINVILFVASEDISVDLEIFSIRRSLNNGVFFALLD